MQYHVVHAVHFQNKTPADKQTTDCDSVNGKQEHFLNTLFCLLHLCLFFVKGFVSRVSAIMKKYVKMKDSKTEKKDCEVKAKK